MGGYNKTPFSFARIRALIRTHSSPNFWSTTNNCVKTAVPRQFSGGGRLQQYMCRPAMPERRGNELINDRDRISGQSVAIVVKKDGRMLRRKFQIEIQIESAAVTVHMQGRRDVTTLPPCIAAANIVCHPSWLPSPIRPLPLPARHPWDLVSPVHLTPLVSQSSYVANYSDSG